MTKSELKKKTVAYLLTQPAGMRLAMMDAVAEACPGETIDSSLLTYSLLDDIIEGAEEKGQVLDYGSHDELGNKPFVVDFVVRKKR